MDTDPISPLLAVIKERAEDEACLLPSIALPGGRRWSWQDIGVLAGALEAVLARHSLTAYHRHTDPCDRHRYRIGERLSCSDCLVVEWTGCQTCRDEFGNPAKPEDCKERAVILAALTGKDGTS